MIQNCKFLVKKTLHSAYNTKPKYSVKMLVLRQREVRYKPRVRGLGRRNGNFNVTQKHLQLLTSNCHQNLHEKHIQPRLLRG